MSATLTTQQQIAMILSRETTVSHLNAKMATAVNWDNIVIQGSKNLVLPAIYAVLKSKKALHILPKDLEVYLAEITEINRNRNLAISKQVSSISQLLHTHNIQHVFLKGTAMLTLNQYNDPSERMLGDIDILVDHKQIKKAFQLLKTNGYSKTLSFAYDNPTHRHLERLIPDTHLAAIELHYEVVATKHQHLLQAKNILQNKQICQGIPIPNAYYLALHNIYNWQLNDHGHHYHKINHRTLYDSLMLNTPKSETLITHLYTTNFGQSFLELAKIYYPDYKKMKSTKKMLHYRRIYLLESKNKYLKKITVFFKTLSLDTKERITLVINNKSYRKHLFNMIFSKKKNTFNS